MKKTELNIRQFEKKDIEKCLDIFDSNCPKYFDRSERELFSSFLESFVSGTPVWPNIETNYFFIGELNDDIVVIGGFYTLKESMQIRFSWGMVERSLHRKGLGKRLSEYRVKEIRKNFPKHSIALDTSQHTYKFYAKMGFETRSIQKDGYAKGLDKYEMESV